MKAVLLINLGTPDDAVKPAVKRYLKEFLNDARVIDYSPIARKILVNGIIIPFRTAKSTAAYQELWTEQGSPLKFHTKELAEKLQDLVGEKTKVYWAMRYQNPSLKEVLKEMEKSAFEEIVIIPLYPQYASSSTGSTAQEVMQIIAKWEVIPALRIITSFFEEPEYIRSVVHSAGKYDINQYDFVLFSFHGLPERHVQKSCKVSACKYEDCISSCGNERRYCYRSACYETTRRIAKQLDILEDKYSVSFQSRLGREPWLTPYSDHVITDLAKKGVKKLLVFSPAFVADCLETTVEIGIEYQELFEASGGEQIQLIESLNSSSVWVKALHAIIEKNSKQRT